MNSSPNLKNIQFVVVYLERRTRRQLVGHLYRKKAGKKTVYVFEYDDSYFKAETSIPVGPELSLLQKRYEQKKMFASFLDRIPSKDNPAYKEYCQSVGIKPDEDDLLILLATLGRKGPSSFVFEAKYDSSFSAKDLKQFRTSLKLSVREFAELFDFSYAAIARTETGKSSGQDILKRAQLYALFPETALFQIHKNGHILVDEKKDLILKKVTK